MSSAHDPLVLAGVTAPVLRPVRLRPLRRDPLLLDTGHYAHMKDPCPVFDGRRWHLFATGNTGPGRPHEILHAIAEELAGPWRLQPPSVLVGVEGDNAAPGVVAEDGRLHMFIQTSFNTMGGNAEHLVSDDRGARFVRADTALEGRPGTAEVGIYDPHPAEISGRRYLVYAAFSAVGRPDVFLASSRSGSWEGPWDRLGCILAHPHVPWHNQHDDPDYEWGLEGPQLLELPEGQILLNATCFLPAVPIRQRQRVFLALADEPTGPYEVLGPVVPDPGDGPVFENGHATALLHRGRVALVFHEWTSSDSGWRVRRASAAVGDLLPG